MQDTPKKSRKCAEELVLLSESPYDTPNPFKALSDPEGLSAVGGDLKPERLIHLYQHGFFPWYSDPDPILWWHPLERCTLVPEHFHASRSLKKCIRHGEWTWRINNNFLQTIKTCSELRAQNEGTWISDEIIEAYSNLNRMGYAFSVEVYLNQKLAGGFYGVAMGNMFFGESMFSLLPNGSKVALWQFCQMANKLGIELIDCQVESDHLLSLGAQMMSKETFVANLQKYVAKPTSNAQLNQLASQNRTHLIEFKTD